MPQEFLFSNKKTSIDLLYDDDDISIVTLDLMHQDDTEEDHNLNMCNISHECIEKSLDSCRNKPIIFRLNKSRTDVTEHANNKKQLQETQIGGIIPQDAIFEFVKRDNGKTYLNCQAILYKSYCPELIQILKNNDGSLEVSTELKCYGTQDEESGIFYIAEFVLQGVCILSPTVQAGIEGSNIQVLKFSQYEMENMNTRYLQFSKKENVNNINDNTKEFEEKEVKRVLNNLTIESLKEMLYTALKDYRYKPYTNEEYTYAKYWIIATYIEEKYIIVMDEEERKLYKMQYTISEEQNNASVDVDNRVEVVEEKTYREVNNAFTLPKAFYGEGNDLVLETSKDKVIKNSNETNDFGKILICNKVLNAKNYKEIINSVFLQVNENYEDNPLENLDYQIMDLSNGSLAYSEQLINFSLEKAQKENNLEIVEKLNSLLQELEMVETIENVNVEGAIINEWEVKYNALNSQYQELQNSYNAKEEELSQVNTSLNEVNQKYEELQNSYNAKETELQEVQNSLVETQNSLRKYHNAEKLEQMKDYFKIYSNSMNKEDNTTITNKLNNVDETNDLEFKDFKSMVDEAVLKYVAQNSKKVVETEIENSLQVNYEVSSQKPTNKRKTIDDVLEDLGITNK